MKQIDFKTLAVDGIDYSDYPDFCDAFICGGFFTDGTPLDDDTLDKLNSEPCLVHETVFERIY